MFCGARTFLVESYVPGLDGRAAAAISFRLHEAIRELDEKGASLRWSGSFALVEEETYICVIEALTIDDVIQLSERAELDHDHVVEAFAIDAPARRGR